MSSTAAYQKVRIASWYEHLKPANLTRRISPDVKTVTLNVAAVQPGGKKIPVVLVFKKRQRV